MIANVHNAIVPPIICSRLCTPDEEYSAFVATAVLCDMDYRDLKNILLTAGRWSDELRELEAVAMPCVYSTTR